MNTEIKVFTYSESWFFSQNFKLYYNNEVDNHILLLFFHLFLVIFSKVILPLLPSSLTNACEIATRLQNGWTGMSWSQASVLMASYTRRMRSYMRMSVTSLWKREWMRSLILPLLLDRVYATAKTAMMVSAKHRLNMSLAPHAFMLPWMKDK